MAPRGDNPMVESPWCFKCVDPGRRSRAKGSGACAWLTSPTWRAWVNASQPITSMGLGNDRALDHPSFPPAHLPEGGSIWGPVPFEDCSRRLPNLWPAATLRGHA